MEETKHLDDESSMNNTRTSLYKRPIYSKIHKDGEISKFL